MGKDLTPKKAYGRTLEEFLTITDDYDVNGLYPAEAGLMEACRKGRRYTCRNFDDARPEAPDVQKNFIRGDFLRFLILGGDDYAPVGGKGVRLRGAWIACAKGDKGQGLDLESHSIPHDIILFDCHIDGHVILRSATVQSLGLDGSSVGNIKGDRLKASGSIHLRNDFEARGKVGLVSVEVGGSLSCEGGKFLGEKIALDLQGAMIKAVLIREGTMIEDASIRVSCEITGTLDLAGATIQSLNIDQESWQTPRKITLDGCQYQRFGGDISTFDTQFWLDGFLGQQKFDAVEPIKFKPFAHNQLAKVLIAMGFEEEARAVNIDRRKRNLKAEIARARKGCTPKEALALLWRLFAGFVTDHGYRPGMAAIYMILLGVLGAGVFQIAANKGIMAPTDPLIYHVSQPTADRQKVMDICRKDWTKITCAPVLPAEHSEFSSLAYSFDVLLPIINFRQQEDWAPRVVDLKGNRIMFGWFTRAFEWAHTGAGWLLSLLLVSGVTGIIRRD